MNLTRIGCISPVSPIRAVSQEVTAPYVLLDSGSISIRVSNRYFYLLVEGATSAVRWAGPQGIGIINLPDTALWSPNYEPD